MVRNEIIKNILHEGLNLQKKREVDSQYAMNQLKDLINKDIKLIDPNLEYMIFYRNSIITIRSRIDDKIVVWVELQFNLNQGPETIKIKHDTSRVLFISIEQDKEVWMRVNNINETYYKIADLIREKFPIYQKEYNFVRIGRKHEIIQSKR